jgi:hypothetical protein
MRRAAAAILCVAPPLLGCGGGTIRPGASEQTVAAFVFKQTGFRPTDVRCPSGIPSKVGSTFECRFTGPDGHYSARVRITSIEGERALDYIVTHRIGS